MFRQRHFIPLFVFALLFAGTRGRCLAGPEEQLGQFETYKWYPAQAESIYQQISVSHPGTEYALAAHRNLVISYILAKRDSDAQQKLNQLSTDFSGNSGLAGTLYEIARVYEHSREFTKAESLYQQIGQQHPSSSEAAKTQINTRKVEVMYHIDEKDGTAPALLDKLIADFNGNSELASALYDIARRYDRAKREQEAGQLYQRITQLDPASPAFSSAQLGVAKVNIYGLIESGDMSGAAAAINSLVTDFGGHSKLPEALYEIAVRYERANANEQAKNLYQQIGQQYPDSSHGSWAQMDYPRLNISSLIESGDYTAAQTAVDNLISGFAGHCYLPKILYSISLKYQEIGQYEQARSIYQQIARLYPESFYASKAQLDIQQCQILSDIEAGNDSAAQRAIARLVTDFKTHPRLPWALEQIAQTYREQSYKLKSQVDPNQARDKIQKAISAYDIIINQIPPSTAVPEACLSSGDCHTKLGEYEMAVSYYQRVVDDYPEHHRAWHAQFMIGRNYELMSEAGLISKPEAEPKIRTAYEQLLQKYPDCKAVKAASAWLNQ
jgi:TolA-binding protein